MRTFLTLTIVVIAASSLVIAAVPNSMNYQGLLTDGGGSPVADASYSVVFTIYDAALVGNSKWTETQNVNTIDGLFSVLLGSVNPILDTVFNETTRYLGIAVAGDPELTPRTELSSVPYAQRVNTIDGSNGGQFTGSVVWSNDMALTDDAMMYLFDPSPAGPSTRRIFSHSPTLQDLGLSYNTSNESFEFAFGGPVMTIEMLTHKVGIGTNSPQSELDVIGTLRAQGVELGVSPTRSGFQSTIGGGGINTVSADWATVAGGQQNVASGLYSTASGGQNNQAIGGWSFVGGGGDNTAGNIYATVGGGTNNTVSDNYSTIAGGIQNSISGKYSSILGGFADTITSNHSYLFGANVNLSQDSTFRVDMPHIQFGSAATGYEFPPIDGTSGQVMATDGSGQLDWVDPAGGGGSSGWVDDGTVVRLDDNNDSVGIGTATPTAPVHISKSSSSATPAFGFKTDFSNTGTGGGVAAYFAYNHGNSSGISSAILATSTANSSDTAYGIGASANNDGTGPAKGGLFTVAGSGSGHKYGIEAVAENDAISEARGVYGIAGNAGSGSATGGFFHAKPGGTGSKWGVVATADGTTNASVTGIRSTAWNFGSGGSTAGSFDATQGPGVNEGVVVDVTTLGSSKAYGFVGNVASDAGTVYGANLDVTASSGTDSSFGLKSLVSSSASGRTYGGSFEILNAGTGTKIGVFGKATGSQSSAVFGNWSTATNIGTGYAYGVFGKGSSNSGDAYGGSFEGTSTSGRAVGAQLEATSNLEAYGVDISATSFGTGALRGANILATHSGSVTAYGLYSEINHIGTGAAVSGRFYINSSGTGVKQAISAAATGNQANSVTGIQANGTNSGIGPAIGAVHFATSNSGDAVAGLFDANTSSGDAIGLDVDVTNFGSGSSKGGNFVINDFGTGTKIGVAIDAEGTQAAGVYGVFALASNDGTGSSYGVQGWGIGSGTGTKYGIYGFESAGGSGAAVYASGDQIATGTKSAIMVTSQGERLMYAVEATEVWFEDVGRAQLNNGHAHIELDALFLETIDVSLNNPMQVFVQLNGDCKGTYVTTGLTGFDVIELQSGTSNVSFTYRIMAKRRGYAVERMRETDAGKYDINLYPERKAEIEAYWNEQRGQTERPERSID